MTIKLTLNRQKRTNSGKTNQKNGHSVSDFWCDYYLEVWGPKSQEFTGDCRRFNSAELYLQSTTIRSIDLTGCSSPIIHETSEILSHLHRHLISKVRSETLLLFSVARTRVTSLAETSKCQSHDALFSKSSRVQFPSVLSSVILSSIYSIALPDRKSYSGMSAVAYTEPYISRENKHKADSFPRLTWMNSWQS